MRPRPDNIRTTLHRADSLTPAEAEAIHHFLIGIFAPGDDEIYAEADYYVRAWAGDQWVSLVEIVDGTVSVGDQPVRVGGIGGVSTLPEFRRQGYSTAALDAAARFIFDEMGVMFGLLLCSDAMVPFYAARGWQHIDAPVYYEWAGVRELQIEGAAMILPHGDALWPPGVVDFNGPSW